MVFGLFLFFVSTLLEVDAEGTCELCPVDHYCSPTKLNACPSTTTSLSGSESVGDCKNRDGTSYSTPGNTPISNNNIDGTSYSNPTSTTTTPTAQIPESTVAFTSTPTSMTTTPTAQIPESTAAFTSTPTSMTTTPTAQITESTVAFTVSLQVTLAEFDNTMREAYINGVATALSIQVSKVEIGAVNEVVSRRRLLTIAIEVETIVTVPVAESETLATSVTTESLSSELGPIGFPVGIVSTPVVQAVVPSTPVVQEFVPSTPYVAEWIKLNCY